MCLPDPVPGGFFLGLGTEFPLIAKPRVGSRSVGVLKIEKQSDLEQIDGKGNYIIQEYLPDDLGEFTAGTMTYDQQCISQIIFRRDLKEGNTYRAYSYEDFEHEQFLKRISEIITGVYGPLNFQYRIKNNQPVIFEINSRFSGTSPLRAVVGVNEVEMAIEYIETGKVTAAKRMAGNVAILRTWSDVIVPMKQINEFAENHFLPSPKADYFPFKN